MQLQISEALVLPLVVLKRFQHLVLFWRPLSLWCFLAPSFIEIHAEIVVFDSCISGLCDISGFSDGFIFGGKLKNVGCAVEKLSGFGVAVLFV